jgi:hypothetical protein
VEQTPVHDTIDDSFALKKICVYLIDQEKTPQDFIDIDQLKTETCGSGVRLEIDSCQDSGSQVEFAQEVFQTQTLNE